jgi:TPR repeat protein
VVASFREIVIRMLANLDSPGRSAYATRRPHSVRGSRESYSSTQDHRSPSSVAICAEGIADPPTPRQPERYDLPFREPRSEGEQLLLQSAQALDADGMLGYGLIAMRAGMLAHAAFWLQRAVQRSHPEAMLVYAEVLANPNLGSINQRVLLQVEELLLQAISFESTTVEAAFRLGKLYEAQCDLHRSVAAFYYAASRGHTDAAYMLAQLKTPTSETRVTIVTAPARAHKQGYNETYPLEAAYPPGHLAFLYGLAAEGGNGDAALELALLILRNEGLRVLDWDCRDCGVAGDQDAATRFLLQAKQCKNTTAMVLLAQLAIKNGNVDAAIDVLREAVDLEDARAMSYLVRVRDSGLQAAPPVLFASNYTQGVLRLKENPHGMTWAIKSRRWSGDDIEVVEV